MVRRPRANSIPATAVAQPEAAQDASGSQRTASEEAPTRVTASAGYSTPEAPSVGRRIRLLVVDRDPRVALTCREALESAGFSVDSVDNVAAATRALANGQHDLTLVELSLPDGTGFDLLRELRRLSPTTVPIVTSAYSTVRTAVEAVRRGAYDYLVKPFSNDVLVESLSDALEKRAFFGSSLVVPADGFQEMLGNSRAMLDLRQWIRGAHAARP
jgi:DNA-binding NtrC family response regulator